MPPSGLPDVFLEGGAESLRQLVLRYAKGRGPLHVRCDERALRAGRRGVLVELERAGHLVRGESRPGGAEREWCDPDVCGGCGAPRSLHCGARSPRSTGKRSRASCRRGTESAGARRSAKRWCRCRRFRCRSPVGDRDPPAARSRRPGRPSGRAHGDRRSRGVGAGRGPRRAPLPEVPLPSAGRPQRRSRRAPGRAGSAPRSRARSSGTAAGPHRPRRKPSASGAVGLVSAGEAPTTPGRRLARRVAGRRGASAAPFLRRRVPGPTATAGRWSQTECLFAGAPDRRASPSCSRAPGIVTRDGVRGQGDSPAATAPSTPSCETSRRSGCAGAGTSKRASAAHAARSEARSSGGVRLRDGATSATRSSALPPIRPSRTVRRCPGRAGSAPARRACAGATLVSLGGEPVLYVERGGRSLVPLRDPAEEWLRPALAALVAHVKAGGLKRLAVERFDGEPVAGTGGDATARGCGVPRRPAPRRPARVARLARTVTPGRRQPAARVTPRRAASRTASLRVAARVLPRGVRRRARGAD